VLAPKTYFRVHRLVRGRSGRRRYPRGRGKLDPGFRDTRGAPWHLRQLSGAGLHADRLGRARLAADGGVRRQAVALSAQEL